MSADPLLELLRGSIPEGGKLTPDALNSFINNAIASSDNFSGFDEATGQVNRSTTSTNRSRVGEEINMTIEFDPERRRSTDLESGLAVQWVRDEPPMERQTHFKLIVEGSETPFIGSYDNGMSKMQQAYPDADGAELHRKLSALRHLDYSASNIKARFDPDIFVKVWQDLMVQRLPGYRISTHYVEFRGGGPADKKEWSCEG